MEAWLADMATWIEAHRSNSEQQLRWWLTEGGGVPVAELPAWLRRDKAITPSAQSLALAGRLAQEGGCRVVALVDPAYPQRIRDALGEQAPPVLYCRGPLALFDLPAFAIIGTRRPTAYGRQAARAYAAACALAGWSVVSGNAIGVDATAHEAALRHGGSTIVFPPVPLDAFRPAFAADAEAAGRMLVASRYAPGTAVTPWNFLGRNQLVAALCRGALVAETGTRGGTLDTVGHLQRLRRPLFVAEIPPAASHYRAFELLRASGARPVPLEPTGDYVAALLHGLPMRDPLDNGSEPRDFLPPETQ
jgi:DNA protecting protein DprA